MASTPYKTNKKENIDKTLTMRKSGSGEKVFSHVGGKTHALEKKAISKKKALEQIRDVTEVEIADRKSHGHHIGSKQHTKNKYK
jgi:hypothetical protein|tara:strand:- start:353 stop:604 length:252 start_codon:yes stop_codon:yes gene_type:complete